MLSCFNSSVTSSRQAVVLFQATFYGHATKFHCWCNRSIGTYRTNDYRHTFNFWHASYRSATATNSKLWHSSCRPAVGTYCTNFFYGHATKFHCWCNRSFGTCRTNDYRRTFTPQLQPASDQSKVWRAASTRSWYIPIPDM